MTAEDKKDARSSAKLIFIVLAVVVLAFIAYALLNQPDRRTTGQKIGDAIDEIDEGVRDASRELEDRNAGEKLGDAIKDLGDDIKDRSRD